VPYRNVDGDWHYEPTVPELVTNILGLAAAAEGMADFVG
jgi:hypothetical protein